MSDIEKIQMERYYHELEDDLRHIVNKYGRIMGWGAPDLNMEASRRLILDALHKAINKIESE